MNRKINEVRNFSFLYLCSFKPKLSLNRSKRADPLRFGLTLLYCISTLPGFNKKNLLHGLWQFVCLILNIFLPRCIHSIHCFLSHCSHLLDLKLSISLPFLPQRGLPGSNSPRLGLSGPPTSPLYSPQGAEGWNPRGVSGRSDSQQVRSSSSALVACWESHSNNTLVT